MPPLKRSLVWRYFIKKDNDNVQCKICKKLLKFNSSTSNMRAHLRCKDHSYVSTDGNEEKESDRSNTSDMASTSITVGSSETTTMKRRKGENQVLSYQKLVVPVSMRSVYWKCYGFPATENGDILTKVKIVCLLCKNVISYNRNTSNLRMHLQNKHAEELVQLESSSPRKISDTTGDRKYKSIKKEGYMYTRNMSGSFFMAGDDHQAQGNLSESHIEDYDENIQGLDSSEMNSSQLNMSASNKPHMELVMSGDQNCTIESLHPFMIPIETKSVSDAVTDFIVMDMQLPDIVEGRGFQRLIATLKSPCEIPSKNKLVEEIIPRMYEQFRESIQETLQSVTTDIALCVEEWETISGDTYATFFISYKQEKEENLSNKVLSTVRCPISMDKSSWELVFENLLEEWNIKVEKIKAVVCATTRQEILDVFIKKGLVVVPCLVHTIQEVCTSVCLDQDDVREILGKCRTIIYLIYKTSNALAALRIQDHLMSLEETPLVSDYPKLWLTTYTMLEALLARRQVLRTILDNIDPTTYDRELVNISDQDWNLIEEVVTVLEPLKVTMMTLSEERTPLVSLIKPLLCQLLSSHLKPKDEDPVNIQLFKSGVKSLLSEKYNEVDLNEFLNIATTLDPRFKSLPNVAVDSKPCLDGPIKDSLLKIVEESPKDAKPAVEESPEKKKPRLLGMVMMLGDMCPATPAATSMSCEDRTNLELVQYQSEASAPLDQCPLSWWAQVSTKCPNLAQLAAQYMCVPATAVPSGRIALDAQLSYESKRANLSSEIIDRIIFLNANHSM